MALPVNWCASLIRKPSKPSSSRSLWVVDRMNALSIDRILLRIWWRTVSLVSVAMAMHDCRRSVAYQRGFELLKGNLTAIQLNDFLTYRCFDVVGGSSGSTYRIRLAGAMN